MDFKYKLIAVAVLALLSGTAFAAPMLIVPLDVKPFPRVTEGPKADFSIDLLYANLSVVEWQQNQTARKWVADPITGNYSSVNVTESIPFTNVTYTVIANVTNLSNLSAKMHEMGFAAAQSIKIVNSALGGQSFNRGYAKDPGVNFGGVVDGVWLDGKWVNTTWVPGKNYPFNVFQIMTPQHRTVSSIPDLPENATDEGTWIEGVPIGESYDPSKMSDTQIYINGAWMDVTGRVQPGTPQPMVLASNTLVDQVLASGTPIYQNMNSSVGPVTAFPGWQMYNSNGAALKWSGGTGFSYVWEPHQSKLIAFTGTQSYNNAEGTNSTLASLENGSITLYGSITSFINNMPVDGTYYNTVATATWLNLVQLQITPNGYIYNAVLSGNQTFQLSPNGIEAFIKEEP
jgi:hypothetical protein